MHDVERKPDGEAQTVAWAGAASNILLTVGKGVVGVLTASHALVADAVHSAADVVGSLAVIIGLHIARKPPDKEHPYGHGKAEVISASLVGGVLIAAGLDVGYSSVAAFFSKPAAPHVVAACAAFVSILLKEFLFRWNYRVGKRLNSKSLMASAYDHRSDVYSSIAALFGIGLALIGRYTNQTWLYYMDPLAGALVALLVLKIAWEILTDSVNVLMDRAVEDEELGPYRVSLESVEGVVRTDEIRIRDHGQYVVVDVKIGVNADISVAQGHDIATHAKQKMMDEFPRVLDVLVHVNPVHVSERKGALQHE